MDVDNLIDIAKEPIEKLTVPLASQVGQTLSDTWELVFGGLSTFVEKKRLTRQKDIEDFKKSLVQNVQSIPPEHLQEPSLSIIGPALEASKFYFEEKDVREFFSKLIANSMDNRFNTKIHSSYVEIIKQMTSLDARNISLFLLKQAYPIASFRYKLSNTSYRPLFPLVFLSNPKESNIEKQAISISSLERLGLLTSSFQEHLESESYDIFSEHDSYKKFTMEFGDKVYYQRGAVLLTPLGKSFIEVCLPPLSPLIVG